MPYAISVGSVLCQLSRRERHEDAPEKEEDCKPAGRALRRKEFNKLNCTISDVRFNYNIIELLCAIARTNCGAHGAAPFDTRNYLLAIIAFCSQAWASFLRAFDIVRVAFALLASAYDKLFTSCMREEGTEGKQESKTNRHQT